MKIPLRIAFVSMITVAALAQDAAIESPKSTSEAEKARQQKLEAERKAKAMLEGKVVTYGGFLLDVAQAEKKSKLLSLRQPADPKHDYQHLHYDERTGRPKGFVLFSLSF